MDGILSKLSKEELALLAAKFHSELGSNERDKETEDEDGFFICDPCAEAKCEDSKHCRIPGRCAKGECDCDQESGNVLARPVRPEPEHSSHIGNTDAERPTSSVPDLVPPKSKGFDEGEVIDLAKFRFCRAKGHFVYKYQIDKAYLIQHFTAINGGKKCKEIYIAHESGDEHHPYEHTHVVVNFGKMVDKRNSRFADIQMEGSDGDLAEIITVHPFIKKIRDEGHWDACVRYMAKEDPENASLINYNVVEKEETTLADKVWSCKTLQEALRRHGLARYWDKKEEKMKSRGRPATEICKLWECKDTDGAPDPEPFYPIAWQRYMLKILHEKGNRRRVRWIVDNGDGGSGKGGACGKSELIAHVCDKYPKDAIFIKMGAVQAKDIARILQGARDAGNSLRIIMFELPRTTIDCERDLYTMLESCCDGMISSGKFSSKNFRFRSEHITVFANFWPKKAMLSADRWLIHKLDWEDSADPPVAWERYRTAVEGIDPTKSEIDRDKALALHAPNITCKLITSSSLPGVRARSEVEPPQENSLCETKPEAVASFLEDAYKSIDNVASEPLTQDEMEKWLEDLW